MPLYDITPHGTNCHPLGLTMLPTIYEVTTMSISIIRCKSVSKVLCVSGFLLLGLSWLLKFPFLSASLFPALCHGTPVASAESKADVQDIIFFNVVFISQETNPVTMQRMLHTYVQYLKNNLIHSISFILASLDQDNLV